MKATRIVALLAVLGVIWGIPLTASAAGLPGVVTHTNPEGGRVWSLSVQTLVLLSSLAFLPAVILMMSAFTRIIIVLSLIRSALGTRSTPPNQILIGLALFLTFFIMSPVLGQIYKTAYEPFTNGNITMQQAIERGAQPIRNFMMHQTRESAIAMFTHIADAKPPQTPADVPMRILLPAFVTSELKTAFQIGFAIFIPFLIIDLIVASVLMSLGMMMLPPAMVSLPFKLMLFVLADGWTLLIGSLARSFTG